MVQHWRPLVRRRIIVQWRDDGGVPVMSKLLEPSRQLDFGNTKCRLSALAQGHAASVHLPNGIDVGVRCRKYDQRLIGLR